MMDLEISAFLMIVNVLLVTKMMEQESFAFQISKVVRRDILMMVEDKFV